MDTHQGPFSWFLKRKPVDQIFIIMVALTLLSPFGFQHLFNIGGHFLAEGVFVLIGFYLLMFRQRYFNILVSSVLKLQYIMIFVGLSILMCIGAFKYGHLSYSYADFRALCVLFLAMTLWQHAFSRKQTEYLLYNLAFWGILFNILSAVMTNSIKVEYPISAALLMMLLANKNEWYLGILVSYGLSVYMAVTSFYRSDWVLVGLGIVMFSSITILRLIKNVKIHKITQLLIILAVLSASGMSLTSVINHYFHTNQGRYIQSIAKTRQLLHFLQGNGSLGTSDSFRLLYYKFMALDWKSLLFPHGLGYRSVLGHVSQYLAYHSAIPANTIDLAYLFWAFHFGLVISLCVLIALARGIFRRLSATQTLNEKAYIIATLILILVYFSVSGSMFTVIEKSFYFGSLLSILTAPKRQEIATSVQTVNSSEHTSPTPVYPSVF